MSALPGSLSDSRRLAIRVFSGDFIIRVQVRGELDLTGVTDLYRALGAVFAAHKSGGACAVDVDISELGFIDSQGWQAVCEVQALLQSSGFKAHITPGVAAEKLGRILGIQFRTATSRRT